MLSEDPAVMANCLGPSGIITRSMIKGGNRECMTRGWLSSLSFQRSFISFTLERVRIFSSFCQAVRCGLPPSVSQSALHAECATSAIASRVNPQVFFERKGIVSARLGSRKHIRCHHASADTPVFLRLIIRRY